MIEASPRLTCGQLNTGTTVAYIYICACTCKDRLCCGNGGNRVIPRTLCTYKSKIKRVGHYQMAQDKTGHGLPQHAKKLSGMVATCSCGQVAQYLTYLEILAACAACWKDSTSRLVTLI